MPAIARRDRVEEAERAHLVKDPVCGMSVDPHTAKYRREHGGRTYYFCAAGCAEKFEAAPQAYLGPERAQAKPAPADAIYTCPMHPEIEQVGPGLCPICGMALEPKTVTVEEEAERRVPRHAPPVLGERRPVAAAAGLGDGRPPARARPRALAPARALAAARAGDAGRAVGRLADLRALLGVAAQPQPEHVDPDRDRRRRRLRVQRGGDPGSGHLPRRASAAPRARSRCTSRPRR